MSSAAIQYGVPALAPGQSPAARRSFDSEMDYGQDDGREFRMYDNPRSSALIDAAQQQFELNQASARAQHFAGQERWQGRENEEKRLVNFLTWMQFIERLQRAGVDARREWSPAARLWMNDRGRMGRLGISAWVTDKVYGQNAHGAPFVRGWGTPQICVVTSVMFPSVSPEWTVMRFNDHGAPTNERYRGWRTALLHLIAAEVITERQAHKAFGRPDGEVAFFYLQQLQQMRKERLGLAI